MTTLPIFVSKSLRMTDRSKRLMKQILCVSYQKSSIEPQTHSLFFICPQIRSWRTRTAPTELSFCCGRRRSNDGLQQDTEAQKGQVKHFFLSGDPFPKSDLNCFYFITWELVVKQLWQEKSFLVKFLIYFFFLWKHVKENYQENFLLFVFKGSSKVSIT